MMNFIKSTCLRNKIVSHLKQQNNTQDNEKILIKEQWEYGATSLDLPFSVPDVEEPTNSYSAKLDWYLANLPEDLPCIVETTEENYMTPKSHDSILKFESDNMIATYRKSTTYIDPNIIETDGDVLDMPHEVSAQTSIDIPVRGKHSVVGSSRSATDLRNHRRSKAAMKV